MERATVFKNNKSQAVRLPISKGSDSIGFKAFRLFATDYSSLWIHNSDNWGQSNINRLSPITLAP